MTLPFARFTLHQAGAVALEELWRGGGYWPGCFLLSAFTLSFTATRAQVLTVSTNLPSQSFGLGQASWSGLSLQGVNLQGTNATPRSGNLNALHTATATMLGPMASSQSLTNPPPAGLIVWWVFDEGSGTTVEDASGNGNSGTLLGDPPPTWANGVTSGALTFDGSQNYVQSDQAFNQTISAFTIEAWFAATSAYGENPAIVSTLGDDIGYNYLADIVIYTNSIFNGNSIGLNTRWDMLFAPLGLVDGNWHHVAGTWDGTNSSLYVDGQLVATQPDAYPAFTWTTPLRLAYRDTNGGCNYGGEIGEIRIYNRALSSDEVAADYNTDTVGDGIPDWWRLKYFGSGTTTDSVSCASCDPNGNGIPNSLEYTNGTNPLLPSGLTVPPNLIAWWMFDEGTGTFVGDVSGNGHSGVLLGDSPPAWTNGVTSGALNFDGQQNYVQSQLPFHETINAYTIEAWFAATSAYGENPAIISTLGDDIGFNYLADIVIYTNSFFHGNSIGLNTRWDVLTAPMGLIDGNWHHVAGTWDGANSSLYVDGQLVATEADTYPAYAWLTPLRLAYRDTNGGCNYGGDIGEVRIYDRALSSNEVAAAYNTDTVGDGIPNWWRQEYFGNGSTTNSYSCASCTSTNPWAYGLTNLQLYQNPSVLISNNYTTFNDGIPDWWRVMYFNTTTTNNLSCAACNPAGDFINNLQKYEYGLNPQVAYTLDVVVNNGNMWVTNQTVTVDPSAFPFPFLNVSLDPSMTNAVVLTNMSSTLTYTFSDQGDGVYDLYFQYLDACGASVGLILHRQITLDRVAPVVLITSPTTNAVGTGNQGFVELAATVYDPDPTDPRSPDSPRPVSISINGQPYWGRIADAIDLPRFPVSVGTNTITVAAQDEAGNQGQATLTWIVDTSTDTVAPTLTNVNLTADTGSGASGGITVPDTGEIWVQGDVDDANAVVMATVNGGAPMMMNVVSNQFGHFVPLDVGTNTVTLAASDAAGNTTSNTFTVIRADRFTVAITNLVFGAFANGQSNIVSGYVSASIDAGLSTETNLVSVTVNGVGTTLGGTDDNGNVGFTTTSPLPPPTGGEFGPIDIQTTWGDGQTHTTPAGMQAAYEVLGKTSVDDAIFLPGDAGGANRPGDGCGSLWNIVRMGDVITTNVYTYPGDPTLINVAPYAKTNIIWTACEASTEPDFWPWGVWSAFQRQDTYQEGVRSLSFGSSVSFSYYRFPSYGTEVVFPLRDNTKASLTFRAPVQYDTNTTVILTFEGVNYTRPDGVTLDLSQVQYLGQSPVSNDASSVSYLLTVNGGQTYTISQDSFQWPSFTTNYAELSSFDLFIHSETFHSLSWTNFHNAYPQIIGPSNLVSTVDAAGLSATLTAQGYLSTSTYQWSTTSQNVQFVGPTTGQSVTVAPIQGRWTPAGAVEVVTLIATFDNEIITNTFNIIVQHPTYLVAMPTEPVTQAGNVQMNITYQILDQNSNTLRCTVPVGYTVVRIANLLASEQLAWQCGTSCGQVGPYPNGARHDMPVRDDGTFVDLQNAPTHSSGCPGFVRSQVLLVGINNWPYQDIVTPYKCICFNGTTLSVLDGTADPTACCATCGF